MPDPQPSAGDADSNRSLWLTIRNFFEGSNGDRSLRAQLEEAIDEHEEESGTPGGAAPVAEATPHVIQWSWRLWSAVQPGSAHLCQPFGQRLPARAPEHPARL